MIRKLTKGVMISFLVAFAISFIVPTIGLATNVYCIVGAAENMKFNMFRIKTASGTIVDWGRDYVYHDGQTVPFTITCDETVYILVDAIRQLYVSTHNDTVLLREDSSSQSIAAPVHFEEDSGIIMHRDAMYISIDTFSHLYHRRILWNGDSMTITIIDFDPSFATLVDSKEMPDAIGNVWKYNIIKDTFSYGPENRFWYNNSYMIITDAARGFSRAYRIDLLARAYEFADDYVYFTKFDLMGYDEQRERMVFTTLSYANTPDNQDGDEIYAVAHVSRENGYTIAREPLISDGVLYYVLYDGVYGNSVVNKGDRSYTIMVVDSKGEDVLVNDHFALREYNREAWELFTADHVPTGLSLRHVQDEFLSYFIEFYISGEWNEFHYKIKIDGTEESIFIENIIRPR